MESFFGWLKTVGGFRRSRHRGVQRTGLYGELVATAYNLVRMSRLIAEMETEVPWFGQWPVVEVRLSDPLVGVLRRWPRPL